MIKRIFLSSFFLFFCAILFAADPNSFFSPEVINQSNQISQTAVSIGYIIQLIFSLAVIGGILYITAKFLLPKLKLSSKSEHIEVFDKLVIEPQVAVYIIKCQNKSWLISVTNKQLTVIDKLDEVQKS